MKIKLNKKICYVVIYLVLFIGLLINIPSKTAYDGVADFDWWSNDIMISDMMYSENFDLDGYFLNAVSPGDIAPDNAFEAEGVQPEMFKKGQYFEKGMYKQYTSNIVIQRFVYRLLDRLFINNHAFLLKFLYCINSALAALAMLGIFYWISDFASSYEMIICSIILVAACPYFTMYGKNLYWCLYSLLLPTAAMAVVIKKGELFIASVKKQRLVLFFTAYIACSLKMLFCFEFVTSVMIGMTIPIFYYCFINRYRLIQIVKMIFWPFIGAMLAFVTVFGVKIILLVEQYGKAEAINLINDNLGKRLWGTVDPGVETYGPIKVTLLMLSKEFLSIKGLFKISFCSAFIILLALVLVAIISKKRGEKEIFDCKYVSLIFATLISALAPISWFVLAAPHTSIHNQHATITFFIPFGILIIIVVEKAVCLIYRRLKNV